MEQRAVADLSGINKTIKELAKSAKEAASRVKSIGTNLQFDPNNIKLVKDRFAALGEQYKANSDLVEKYKQKIKELESEQSKLERISKKDRTEEQTEQYKKVLQDIAKYNRELEKAKSNVEYLEHATDKHIQKQAEFRAITAKSKETLEAFNKVTKVVSVALISIAGAIAKAASSSVELGTELYNLSIRYNTNVKDIQVWNRALQLATGQTDLFTTAINTMVKGLSQISSGRGVAYQQALKNIGLSYQELTNLSTVERFEAIVEALGDTADANTRLEAAQQLLGESGQSIAQMFEDETFSLDAYLEKARTYGTLTQENAKALAEMGFELEYSKSQMKLATAQMTVALAPAITSAMNAIANLVTWLTKLGQALGFNNEKWQKILLVITIALITVPKLSQGIGGLVTWFVKMIPALQAINLATAKWQVILLAISAVIIVIISLLAVFSKSAQNALDTVNELKTTTNSLSEAGQDFGTNIETVNTSSSSRSVAMNVDIHGYGDTTISDEAAQKVAELTADQLNKSLGDLIK